MNHFSNWNDTIAAIATPPGIGALGIIRISGPAAISIINQLFPSKNLEQQPSHTLHIGFLQYNDKVLDEVVVSIYKSPRSYTGEHIAEISCHGSPYILQQVLNACLQAGARLARPGEFTQRAFLNGKLDLVQAESVADLIAADTTAAQQTALQHMRGGFSTALQLLRDELIRFSSLVELELDFSQEDVAFADRLQFMELVERMELTIRHLLQSFSLGNAIKKGMQVAIIGRPNVGKSTLLNALLNEERAIVSEIAGTTRDSIEETLNINGIVFRFADTAGIRNHTADRIEQLGIERSYQNAAKADVVLHLMDVSEPEFEDTAIVQWLAAQEKKVINVYNKTDIATGKQIHKDTFAYVPGYPIAALTGQGVEELKTGLFNLAIGAEITTEDTIVTNARHYYALQQAAISIADIKAGLNNGLSGDLLSLDIRTCLHHLGTITGQITHEDQLDFIFSKFCIGK